MNQAALWKIMELYNILNDQHGCPCTGVLPLSLRQARPHTAQEGGPCAAPYVGGVQTHSRDCHDRGNVHEATQAQKENERAK